MYKNLDRIRRCTSAGRVLPRLFFCFFATACSSPESTEQPPDAGTPSQDLAPASTMTVTGTRKKTHVAEPNQRTDRAVDLSGVTIEALVPASGDTYTVVPGVGSTDGSFSIPGVSISAPYYLHYYDQSERPPHVYVYTASANVDLGEYSGERSGVVRGASGSALRWDDVGGFDAWGASDQILYYSSDNASYFYGTIPAAGSSALNLTQSFVGQPLLSSARADNLYVLQLQESAMAGGEVVHVASKTLKLSALDLTDGISTPVSGTVARFGTPPMRTASLDYRRSQFAALHSASAPAASLSATINHQLFVAAILGGASLTYGFYTNSADLLAYVSTANSDVALDQISFGNPFSDSYGLYGSVSATFSASYSIPGATAPVKVTAAVNQVAPLAAFTSGPIAPKLGPVTDLQINGQSAYTITAAVGAQPVLSWSPPQLGSATSYVVAVLKLSLRAGTTQITQTLLAQLHTTQTRVVLPPGLLQSGEYYVFRVVSHVRSGYDLSRPYRHSFPADSAATLTALVTP